MPDTKNSNVDFKRVFDIVPYQEIKFPQEKALNEFEKGEWRNFGIHDIKKKIDDISCWLIANGFVKGDKVAFVPRTGNPMWMMLDFACQQTGLIIVPLHPTYPIEELGYILSETEACLCITADSDLYDKVEGIIKKENLAIQIYHLENGQKGYFKTMFEHVSDNQSLDRLKNIKETINHTDTLAIMYTSGTSGVPKGVVLTHKNVVTNIKSILPILPLKPMDRVLSFLPFSHILERTTCYAYMAIGAEIYFNQHVDDLANDFKSVKPYFCTAVPKTLEKTVDFLHQQRLQRNKITSALIKWSMGIAEKYKDQTRAGFLFGFKLFWARTLVLNIWRKKLGGKIRYIGVGAAALDPKISRLFSAAGVMTLAGYGLTEASPFVTVNRPGAGMNKHGTVGLAIPGVDIKIESPDADGDGEILVRGPNVMSGYFKRPELTAEVLTNGWLRTGDIGRFTDNHFLLITDRKKDIFKTSSGKYIAPQQLENLFASSPYILQSLIIGFNRPFVTALLVPNFSLLRSWCGEEGIHWTSPQFMIHNIKIVEKIQTEVDNLNEGLETHKKVRKFVLSEEEWTAESNYLSVSLKLVRDRIESNFQKEIEDMYQS